MDSILKIDNLSVSLAKKTILDNVSLDLQKNQLLAINGANGAGKTTLIRAIMGMVKCEGDITLFGKDIRSYSGLARARHMAVVSQIHNRDFGYSVCEVVRFGLYNRKKGFFGAIDKADLELSDKAMEQTGIANLKDRSITTLSGGELQRVFLAQAFTQNPDILILDEPTNNLDIGFQLTFFETINEWKKQENKAVLAIIHDLTLSRLYADRVLLLNNGKTVALDTPALALTPKNLEQVYNKLTANIFGN